MESARNIEVEVKVEEVVETNLIQNSSLAKSSSRASIISKNKVKIDSPEFVPSFISPCAANLAGKPPRKQLPIARYSWGHSDLPIIIAYSGDVDCMISYHMIL